MRPVPASLLVVVVLLAGCMGGGGPKQVPTQGDLEASFDATPQVAGVGETIQFQDTSNGTIALWRWDFGDGATSEDQNPEHAFAKAGVFTVTLSIEDAAGNVDAASHDIEIGELGGDGTFRVDFRYRVSGKTVDFEPVLTPEDAVIDLYHWDFGDGETSRDSAPTHTYATDDVYTVTLRASSQARISQAQHLIAIGVEIGEPTDLAAKSFAVVAVIDSGINPYHSEFRDRRFDAHPSQYVSGYPPAAMRLDLSLDAQTYKDATVRDEAVWEAVEGNTLYWIPGTRIIGAISMDPYGSVPILDEDSHGTATASDAAGATIGSCPDCLIVVVEGPSDEALDWAFEQPWIDVVSNSWGYCFPSLPQVGCQANTGIIPELLHDPGPSREAVERGQEVLYAAGNGVLNSFDAPTISYLHSQTGPDWILTVGAADAANSARIVGTGRPFDVTSYGANWRGASHQSTNSINTFSGTSAATPVVAGAYAKLLMSVRGLVGDTAEGPRPGAVVAQGEGGGMLADGRLTRAEAERALLLTAKTDGNAAGTSPLGLPGGAASFLYSGYGLVDAASADDAIKVAMGEMAAPSRANEDLWASVDSSIRIALYGDYDDGGGLRATDADAARVDELLAALGISRADLGLA